MPELLQDITYTYDPVGNVTHLENPLSDVVDNAGQKVSPDFDYTYDALYRLTESQGREHPGIGQQGQEHQNNFGDFWDKTPISDASKITSYTESYNYDPGNNLESIQHQGKKNWKRTTTIAKNANRLASSVLGSGQPTKYNYDAAGNQTDMGGKTVYWNYRNNIDSVGIIDRVTGDPDAEYYVYDSGGSRVRKVNETQANGGANTIVSEVVYLGNFEIRRKGSGTTKSEWHQMRYSDGKNIFCELRYQTQGKVKAGQTNHQTRYQLSNLINSIGMEVDGAGALISYEEYYPYGGTSFIAGKNQTEVKSRHYRYSGKEQDRSGLYYYGMRYYCSWMGRWMSADPAGTVDGLNLYAFVGGNPVTHVDVGGLGKVPVPKPMTHKAMHPIFHQLGGYVAQGIGPTLNSYAFFQAREDIESKLDETHKIWNSHGLSGHDMHKATLAAKIALSGTQKSEEDWTNSWRKVHSSMDEHVSSISMFHLLRGIGDSPSFDASSVPPILMEHIILSSMHRLPTCETGVNVGGEIMQHPTSPGSQFFGSIGKGHNIWDRQRRQSVAERIQAFDGDGFAMLTHMTLSASLWTMNRGVAPATAKNVETLKGITMKQKQDQVLRQEGIKEGLHSVFGVPFEGGIVDLKDHWQPLKLTAGQSDKVISKRQ